VGEAERARIAAEPREAREQRRIGRAGEQCGEQRVFLCAREIDLVDGGRRLAIEIRAQADACDAGCSLHGEYAFCGNLVPVRHGRLRYADAPGEFRHSADCLYGFAQTRIAHQSL
jgi:hypothetical protein